MKQQTLVPSGFEKYGKTTRRAQFLEQMDRAVPWAEIAATIEPFYPKPSELGGRPAIPLERMPRVYFLQLWFNLSDPAVEEALYDSEAMRRFVGIDLGQEAAPDETTVCKFRHLLERNKLIQTILASAANVADVEALPHLLHGRDRRVYGDQAYRGRREAIRRAAPQAKDFTNQRYRWGARTDEILKARNARKSKVRAKVEHAIGVIKRVFGFQKVRYRGLAKNLHCMEVTAALANLFMVRRRLLRA